MTTIAEIRAEYERSIPDAYAGGPAARAQAWQRLANLIHTYAADASSPTIDKEPAGNLSEPDKRPARQTAPRKATS
jgi:hypothetical protein